jgi:hypothetical protein
MANPLVTLNLLDGAQVEQEGPFRRSTHVALIEGIDTSDDWLVMHRAIEALAGNTPPVKVGDFHPSGDGTQLWRLRVIPFRDDAVRVVLTFEKPLLNWTPTAYVIRDRGYMTEWETEFLFGSKRQPLFLVHEYETVFTSPIDKDKTTLRSRMTDAARHRALRPMKVLNVSGLKYGTPPAAIKNSLGYVNDATWQGLDKGYWLMMDYQTDVAKFAGYYTYSASAITKIREDWGEPSMLRDHLAGKLVQIDPDAKRAAQLAEDFMKQPYEYGMKQLTTTDSVSGTTLMKGLGKIGDYETTSFSAIFGF